MLLLACGAYGLVIGSFLNVVIHRVPQRESVVRPRSRCPGCGTEIAGRDNVPVASWLLLRGRCRTCRQPISVRYPAVEALCGVLFVLVALRFGLSPALPAYLALAAALLAVAAIDLEHFIVPKLIVYPALGLGVVLLVAASAALGERGALLGAVVGAAVAWSSLFAIHVVAPRGLGFGDVRLSLVLGFHLGWLSPAHVFLGLFLAFVLGALTGILGLGTGRLRRGQRLPFAPFLALGTLLAVLVGGPILRWYPPTAGVTPVASCDQKSTPVPAVEIGGAVR